MLRYLKVHIKYHVVVDPSSVPIECCTLVMVYPVCNICNVFNNLRMLRFYESFIR